MPPSPYVFGIDFGTSSSAIAVFKDGQAQALQNRMTGRWSHCSVVYVHEDGSTLVGEFARKRMMISPENGVSSIKRELGGPWTKEFAALPGKVFTPTDISALIISELLRHAEKQESLCRTPEYAFLCVPANFNSKQRAAMQEAGECAGLKVVSLVEEPVAAAVGLSTDLSRDQTILVYDLEEGTLALVRLNLSDSVVGAREIRILANECVPNLGEDALDRKIMKIEAELFKESSGFDILGAIEVQGISPVHLRKAERQLRGGAEDARRHFCEEGVLRTHVAIPFLMEDERGRGHHLDTELTREQFDAAIRPLVDSSATAVERALRAARLAPSDISRVILLGPTAIVPLVKQAFTQMFGQAPWTQAEPETFLARGAASMPAERSASGVWTKRWK